MTMKPISSITKLGGVPLLFLIIPLLFVAISTTSQASLIINEVAYKGSGAERCDGEDWVELLYQNEDQDEDAAASLDLTNYTLHDDKGKDDKDAKIFDSSLFPSAATISSGEYLVLCKGVDFEFGIGGNDAVTLLDNSGTVLSTVVLPGTGADDETYAYFSSDDDGGGVGVGGSSYKYTATPTPGSVNVYTEPIPLEVKLKEQNDAGNDFFLVVDDNASEGEEGVFSKVVDINLVIEDDSLAGIKDHPSYSEWAPFTEVTVSNIIGGGAGTTDDVSNNTAAVVSSSSGGGRIRTKGQSTLMMTACRGLPNVPFQIEFDSPFMGLETMYLRAHMVDQSYMREYASHAMLKRFGLPYLRTRPVRLSINGEYIGFYTMMEAPTQGYVMQRSFGAFDPEQTALFKMKTLLNECPFNDPTELETAANRDVPDPYYFERGDHRVDIPVFEEDEMEEQCWSYFFGELIKRRDDIIKGYLEYNQTCGLAFVELGRVDRDYGPKTMEPAMVSFLDSKFYNASIDDLKDSVDADQWIKNFAAYAVMLNVDSPIGTNPNNWYLATTEGGVNDWRIVQYDHDIVTSSLDASLCDVSCGPKSIYWPILRPGCGAVEDHTILGRILNDEESMQKYLDYVQEFVDIMTTSNLLDDVRSYGNGIKEYIMDDPYNQLTMEEYEEYELGTNSEDYNRPSSPYLKTMEARLAQVQAQLDAINEGTLPRNGVYGEDEKCPDWRASSGEDYMAGSTVAESCTIEVCFQAAFCYDNNEFGCSREGEFVFEDCKSASPFCDSCFPYSRCGSGGDDDKSGLFVETSVDNGDGDDDGVCGPLLAECATATSCFDHKSGMCAYDGEILTVECAPALPFCKPCFPYSRCGGLVVASSDENETYDGPFTSPGSPANATVTSTTATACGGLGCRLNGSDAADPQHAICSRATAVLLAVFSWFLFA